MEDFKQYLQPTKFLNFKNPNVKRKALEITKGLKTDKEKVRALFYWVRDEIKYNMMTYVPQVKSNFKASVTLRRRYGFCVSKAILLSTFSRAQEPGIPARIHLVDIINHKISQKVIDLMGTNIMHYHGYSELYVDGKWIKAAPVFDQATAIKGGFLPMTEFDGENNALFPHNSTDGSIFVEYTGDRGIYADLPLDDIEKVFNEKYGSAFYDSFTLKSRLNKKST